MTDFDYDVMQKKRTATGAFHRKGGSKSKKCSLPSDNLTEAQRRKLNGPVTSVKLDQPMKWDEFKALSDDLKREYLKSLMETYQASQEMLAKMFGVSQSNICLLYKRLGMRSFPKSIRPHGEEQKRRDAIWKAFCNGVVGGGNSIIPEANDVIEPENERIEKRVWDLDSPDHVNACRCEEVLDEDGNTVLAPVNTEHLDSPVPQVTCYDPVAEAEERAKERLVSLMEQGASQYDEERETQYAAYYDAARDAVDEMLKTPMPAAPAPAVKEIRTRMSALAVRYEGPTGEVSGEIAELMSLFNGTRIKVKLSVEVVE